MEEKGRITNVQYAMILLLTVIGTSIIFEPGLIAQYSSGRDAWIVPFFAGIGGFFVIWIMVRLQRMFPGKTPIEYLQLLFGKWVGRFWGFFLICFLLGQFSIMIREFSDFTSTVTLTRTPKEWIILLMLLVVYYGVRKGLEVIARVVQLIFLLQLIPMVIIIFSFSIKDIDLSHFIPIVEHGPLSLLRSTLQLMSWFGELMIVGFLLPYRETEKGTMKASVISVLGTALLVLLSNLMTIGVFGHVISSRMQFGLYEVARYISIAEFLERLDPIIMGAWIMLIFCKLLIFCYVISLSTAQLFLLKEYQPLVGIICLVAATLSEHMFRNQVSLTFYISVIQPLYLFSVEVLVPLVLLGWASIQQRLKEGT